MYVCEQDRIENKDGMGNIIMFRLCLESMYVHEGDKIRSRDKKNI